MGCALIRNRSRANIILPSNVRDSNERSNVGALRSGPIKNTHELHMMYVAPLKCNGAAITQPCMEGCGVYDPSPLHGPAERRMFFTDIAHHPQPNLPYQAPYTASECIHYFWTIKLLFRNCLVL